MYEEFYGFEEKPFAISPDPSFLFLSRKHKRALTLLAYGLENEIGFTVITGEIGSGKTTLIRALLNHLDERITVGLVSNTQCETFEELLRWILFAFELDYRKTDKVELYDTFTEFLLKEYAENRRTVLIVDEAQHLGPSALEQLRMLSNVNADKDQMLQIILVGQPELRKTLLSPELHQFAQRIGVDYHLMPLDAEETRGYIQRRLILAGGNPKLFADDTFDLIWKSTQGIPRLINILCDTALVYGFSEQQRLITAELVRDVVRDKQTGLSTIHENSRPDGHMRGETGEAVRPQDVSDARKNGPNIEKVWPKG